MAQGGSRCPCQAGSGTGGGPGYRCRWSWGRCSPPQAQCVGALAGGSSSCRH
jgi:hypothetical protein